MKLEKSQYDDAREVGHWMIANLGNNNASLGDLKHCQYYKIAGILHLPVRPVLLLESLAPNPAVTGKKRLLALRRAMDDLRKMYPYMEIVFFTRGNTVLDAAAKYYGFSEVPFKVYRMRPNDKSRAAQKYRAKVSTEEVRAFA
jgi:hypothetical protein